MKIKTSDLTKAALDWAVAKCEGWRHVHIFRGDIMQVMVSKDERSSYWFNPTGNWSQGGPIIDRERIELHNATNGERVAHAEFQVYAYGQTSLTAAMRCFVASKLGDEVDVPDELVEGLMP